MTQVVLRLVFWQAANFSVRPPAGSCEQQLRRILRREYALLFRPNTYGILGWPEFERFADRRPGMPPDESSPPSLSTVPLVGAAVNAALESIKILAGFFGNSYALIALGYRPPTPEARQPCAVCWRAKH